MNDDILNSFWTFMQEKDVYSCDVPADIIEKALDFSISEKELELKKRAKKNYIVKFYPDCERNSSIFSRLSLPREPSY